MDPASVAVLAVVMRWVHIASVVMLIGGFVYARFVLAPSVATLPDPEREIVRKRAMGAFRPIVYVTLLLILGSGAYNYATKATYPPHYHMWMGIKLLVVLHIVVSAISYSLLAADEVKRKRRELSIAISGLVVIAIAGYLRYLST